MKSESEIRDNLRWLKLKYADISKDEKKEIGAKVDALEWVLKEV